MKHLIQSIFHAYTKLVMGTATFLAFWYPFIFFLGTRRKDDYAQDTTFFHKLQENYWEDLLLERKKEMEAKNKFRGKHWRSVNIYKRQTLIYTMQNLKQQQKSHL